MQKQNVLVSIKKSMPNAKHLFDIVIEINNYEVARIATDELGNIYDDDFHDKYLKFVRDIKLLIQYSDTNVYNILDKKLNNDV